MEYHSRRQASSTVRRLFLITLLAALPPCMNAQRMSHASPRFASGFNRSNFARSSFYPLAFSDPFYSDYLLSTGYPVASQPPMIFLQAPPAAAPAPERFSAPVQPLMIELQGDRYVRVSGPELSGAEMIDRERIDRDTTGQEKTELRSHPHSDQPAGFAAPAVALPPALLIFHDGHREEISDYTIADGVLYTRANYYVTGSWNRKIELSSLNLPETVASNQSRGANFRLPSSPNEVIVGP
jgi:hypothetical protein